jgi:hypothetical protein
LVGSEKFEAKRSKKIIISCERAKRISFRFAKIFFCDSGAPYLECGLFSTWRII